VIVVFCDSALLSQLNMFGLHCGVWPLTAHQVRDITFPLLWHTASIGNGEGAKLPGSLTNFCVIRAKWQVHQWLGP